MVRLAAGYGVEEVELDARHARSLAVILPLCLPFRGELPVVDAILATIDVITAGARRTG
jgi:hypothetical protein